MNKVYVIGGTNIDIIGIPYHKLKTQDSNPGKLEFAHGGVGRNIAENLALLNKDVTFVSAVGNDGFARELIEHLKACKINTDYIIRSEKYSTSSYLAILDENKDMHVALADMEILNELTIEYIHKILINIEESDFLIIDTNLDEALIEYILTHTKARVFVDPISCAKAVKLKALLAYVDVFKPNIYEAAALCNHSVDEVEKIADTLIKEGVKHLYLSLGEKGILYKNAHETLWISGKCANINNATGAGDACMAAIVSCTMNNTSVMQTLEYAIACAIITLESKDSVYKDLSHSCVLSKMKTIEYKEELR